jgi:hypothetical protein
MVAAVALVVPPGEQFIISAALLLQAKAVSAVVVMGYTTAGSVAEGLEAGFVLFGQGQLANFLQLKREIYNEIFYSHYRWCAL